MCSVTAGIAVAGLVLSGYGMTQQAKSAKRQAQAQAQINELQAQDAEDRGRQAEQRARLRTRQLRSAQEAGFAAQGVELSSGSVEDVLAGTDLVGELDAQTIQRNAAREAWGYRTAAGMARYQGASRAQSANAQAGGSLLTAASVGYGGYQDYRAKQ